jgi:hypothetical protein
MAVTYEDLQSNCRQVTTYDNYFTALCPFHNDSAPSLLVFKDGWFRCLGSCGRNGTWITLWNKLKGQPIQVMPERHTIWGIPKVSVGDLEEVCYQAHEDLLAYPTLGWYLEMRGIEGRIERNELGYWDGWYTIPVTDKEGQFVTAIFRAAPHVQQATGLRYYCPHHPVPFVPDWKLYNGEQTLFVVYGAIDALVISDLRFPVITSSAGNKSFSGEWLDNVRKPINIVPDKGEEKVARGLAAVLGWRGRVVNLPYPEGIKDPAGYYEKNKKGELMSVLLKENK